MRYFKIILILLVLTVVGLFTYKLSTNDKDIIINNDKFKNMIGYTIDGAKTSSMPTKGSDYKVKSITCEKGSVLSFDNDNWLVEVESIVSEDFCKIDFTKNTTLYQVTVSSNNSSYLDSTSKTTTHNGQVTFYTDADVTSVSGCTYEVKKGKVIIKNVTGNVTCNITLSYPTFFNQLLSDKTIRPGERTDFSTVFTNTNTHTLYTSTENGTTVYYFAGNALDNWVKFGGYYWRIIRTNSDGSIRLLYHSTSHSAEDAYIGTSAFNSTSNDSKYVGYMYDSNGTSSTIKKTIDAWYKNNLTNYTKYLSTTAIYCNDRLSTGTGNYTYFGAYTRLDSNKEPTYNCTNDSDAFSVSNTSAKLDYPIGLMTADEIVFAGGVMWENTSAYYYKNSAGNASTGKKYWHTMSPYNWHGSSSFVFTVNNSTYLGRLGYAGVESAEGVRPVISLKSCVKYASGNGTSTDPYEIVLDGGC